MRHTARRRGPPGVQMPFQGNPPCQAPGLRAGACAFRRGRAARRRARAGGRPRCALAGTPPLPADTWAV